jgi:hypothetical protein
MNPGFTYYMPFGLPATGYFTVSAVPAIGMTITAGLRTYTFGTDFSGNSTFDVAKSLSNAINACRNILGSAIGDATLGNPINFLYASYTGTRVYVIATVPGLSGNTIPISSSDTASISVSGTTMAGGTTNATGTGVWVNFTDIGSQTVTIEGLPMMVYDSAGLGRSGLFRGSMSQTLTPDAVNVINDPGTGQWVRITSF